MSGKKVEKEEDREKLEEEKEEEKDGAEGIERGRTIVLSMHGVGGVWDRFRARKVDAMGETQYTFEIA